MSIKATRIDYTIGFVLGVLGVLFGIFLIFLQFSTKGYVVDFSPSDPYSIFAGWAALGVVSLVAGTIAIYYTYSIFTPLEAHISTSTRVCSHCGALIEENSIICEKCRQPTTNN